MNENKHENDKNKDIEKFGKDKSSLKRNSDMSSLWFLFLLSVIWLFSFNFNLFINVENTTPEFNLTGGNIVEVEDEDIFTCVKYTPVFEVDGTKKYEVRFRTSDSYYFTVLVDGSEIDEKGNIEEDARYRGVITYAYIDKAFEERTKDMDEAEKSDCIVNLLNSKSEYVKYGDIVDIDFMYGDYVENLSRTSVVENLESLIAESNVEETGN